LSLEGLGNKGRLLRTERKQMSLIFRKDKKEDAGKCRLVSLTLIPRTVVQQILLGTISKHMQDKKVTGSSQHGFTKGRLCLTLPVAFCDEMTGLEDEGTAVDLFLLTLRTCFQHCLP